MVHSAQGRSVPTETEADYLDTIVRLCSAMSALKAENAALRRDLVKALKPRNLKPLRESYARLLHGPSVGMSAANEPNPARLAAELQAVALALRIGGLDGLRSGQVKIGGRG